MSLERALAPLALVVALAALVVWLLLVNDVGLGPWLLALLVFAHGWVHLMFVFPKPESPNTGVGGTAYPFDFERSWLIRRQVLEAGLVRRVGLAVVTVTFVLGLLAALATVGLLLPADWWAPLMVGAALASTLTLVLFYSPALILGFAIDAAMILLVVSGSWSPA
jgi:hypothetical protein